MDWRSALTTAKGAVSCSVEGRPRGLVLRSSLRALTSEMLLSSPQGLALDDTRLEAARFRRSVKRSLSLTMCVYIYTCTHIYIYVHTHIYIYIYR